MDWHTTGRREELLIVLAGRVVVETRVVSRAQPRRWPLSQGQSCYLPAQTEHQVLHVGARTARYIYVTG